MTLAADPRSAGLDPAKLAAEARAAELAPGMPEGPARAFARAQQLYVAGWAFHDLFTAAGEQAVHAIEEGLRARFVAGLKVPLMLLPRNATGKELQPHPVVDRPAPSRLIELLRDHYLTDLADFRGSFDDLVTWASTLRVVAPGEVDRWKALANLRARTLAGHTLELSPGMAIGLIREAAERLNALFPTGGS